MTEPRTLVLVDGSSYLYRAFHALPPLANSRGEPTGAVLGVLNMLAKLLKEQGPALIGVVFDAPGKTFRDELFAEYKAHRPPMPDDLRAQVEPLIAAVEALGLPLLRVPGVEADDVIGTLARRAAAGGLRVVISTGDKDMAQLVDARITLVNTMTDSSLDRAGVKIKFDVYPEQIVDYLALVGDSSDNIPGVPKVGPKTAAKWLNQYTTLDNLLAHQDEIEGKVGESLRAHNADLALSRQLATIDCELGLELRPEDLQRREPDVERLRDLYTRLELRSLLRQLPGGRIEPPPLPQPVGAEAARQPAPDSAPAAANAHAGDASAAVPRNYETVLREDQLEAWLERLRSAEVFAFDTETTSLDYMQAEIVGVSFCVEPGHAAYVPVAHTYPGAPEQLDRASVLGRLKPLLEDAGRAKLGHHLKYDAHVLRNHGIELRGMRYDSMLESYVLNSTATRHDLDSTAKHYLGVDTIHYEDVAGKGAKQLPFSEVPVERAAEYSAEDSDVSLQLHRTLWSQLERLPKLRAAVRGDRAAAGAGAARHGAPRRADRSGDAAPAEPRDLEEPADARAVGARCRGHGVQPRFAEAAAGDPVRQARPAGEPQDRNRPALHGGGRARGTRGRVRAAAHHPRVPRPREAQVHLHGQAARAGRSAHRARAHLVSPGGGRDRSPVVHRPQPAEHPGAHARGPAHPRRRSWRRPATC